MSRSLDKETGGDQSHICLGEHLYWCQRCDYQLFVPVNASPKMRTAMSKTFMEEHVECR